MRWIITVDNHGGCMGLGEDANGAPARGTPEQGDALPMDAATLRPGMQLFDIVAARDTELMAAAKERGLETVVGGRPMIEHQAKAQIAFLDPPPLPA